MFRSAALSQKAALQMPLAVTTPPVKMRLERSAERDKREIKNNYSAEDAQSASGGHFQPFPCSYLFISCKIFAIWAGV